VLVSARNILGYETYDREDAILIFDRVWDIWETCKFPVGIHGIPYMLQCNNSILVVDGPRIGVIGHVDGVGRDENTAPHIAIQGTGWEISIGVMDAALTA